MQMQDGSQIGYFRRPSDRMVVSRTLITVDTAEQKNADWQYIDPTSDTILTRAHARMVWIPVGEQGLLIVVGGVLAGIGVGRAPARSGRTVPKNWPGPARAASKKWLGPDASPEASQLFS